MKNIIEIIFICLIFSIPLYLSGDNKSVLDDERNYDAYNRFVVETEKSIERNKENLIKLIPNYPNDYELNAEITNRTIEARKRIAEKTSKVTGDPMKRLDEGINNLTNNIDKLKNEFDKY